MTDEDTNNATEQEDKVPSHAINDMGMHKAMGAWAPNEPLRASRALCDAIADDRELFETVEQVCVHLMNEVIQDATEGDPDGVKRWAGQVHSATITATTTDDVKKYFVLAIVTSGLDEKPGSVIVGGTPSEMLADERMAALFGDEGRAKLQDLAGEEPRAQ